MIDGVLGREITGVGSKTQSQPIVRPQPTAGGFHQVLQKEAARIRFSAHAQQRMANLSFGASDLQRLEAAVDRVAAKGGRESLVLMEDIAFVVSVPNRTVITAVDRQRAQENVFTQIDSAVIA